MTLGLRESRMSERRAQRRRFVRWLMVFVGVVAAGYYAYETGTTLARRQVTELSQKVTTLEDNVTRLERRNTELAAALEVERERGQELRARYERDVPKGQTKAFLDQIQARQAEGLSAERLAFLIQSARKERECDGEPQTKRFLVSTPIAAAGGNDSVTFANNAITVTANGQPARDSSGNPEGWFDPALDVTLQFAVLGGATSEAKGMLPLHHGVVMGDSEHRFSVIPGNRGFLRVTADRCAYP